MGHEKERTGLFLLLGSLIYAQLNIVFFGLNITLLETTDTKVILRAVEQFLGLCIALHLMMSFIILFLYSSTV